jgi:AbiV family abortive infection protein
MEQCGHLLQHSVILHNNKVYASAVMLALLAREEFGRYHILLDLWRQVKSGKSVSVEDVRKACDDHVVKQREAQLSLVYRAEGPGVLLELLRTRGKFAPGTSEYEKADEQLKELDKIKSKHTPGSRHSTRMKATYVDINDSGFDWNRPVALPEGEATNCLVDAINDYSVKVDGLGKPEILKHHDASLADALEAWNDKPPLPSAKWPDQLGSIK